MAASNIGSRDVSRSFLEFPRADIEQSIASRFEAQVALHGTHIAVQDERQSLSYDELNGHANNIAWTVLERSEGRPGAIALLLEHSTLLPAVVLGVLKTGGFYVQLDADNPLQRNAFILADSGTHLLLTDCHNRAAALALTDCVDSPISVIVIEETGVSAEGKNPDVKVSPHDLCFLVYTSGSTGKPKGVCQLHRNVLHGTMVYTNLALLGSEDRLSLLHPMSVIAGATSLFGALLNGATILPFRVQKQGLAQLAVWLEQEQISCFHTVPTIFRRFARVAKENNHSFNYVRLLRLGGEAVTQNEWQLYRDMFSTNCRLLTGLTSTEAFHIRMKLFTWHDNQCDAILPIGDPVPDMTAIVVDENGALAATGSVGEIIARSEFLFSGYWNRDDLTAQVLSVDPEDTGRRVFRTGELGRFSADGRFYYAGRLDSQVKIAGQRVELAEVEQALRQIPTVQDAAVVLRSFGSNTACIEAFVVPYDGLVPSRNNLQVRLGETLPKHFVPSSFNFVDDLPMLPGGKIDRQHLAALACAPGVNHVQPRDPIEETILEIWQRVLGRSGIGVHDDFFYDLGGDSLTVAEILTEMSSLFHVHLPLSVLYEAPSIAELAKCLVGSGWHLPDSGLLVVNRDGDCPPLFGICGAYGHALRLLLIGRSLASERPFYGLQPPGMDWSSVRCSTIEQMAGHYYAAISRLQPRGPYHLLGTSFGGVVAFEIAAQMQSAGEDVALLSMVDTIVPNCNGPDGISHAVRNDWVAGKKITADIIGMGVRVAKAHRAALDQYILHKTFEGTITYFHCAGSMIPSENDRRLLWDHFATGGQQLISVPGKHGEFHREPQFSAVVAGLRAAL